MKCGLCGAEVEEQPKITAEGKCSVACFSSEHAILRAMAKSLSRGLNLNPTNQLFIHGQSMVN